MMSNEIYMTVTNKQTIKYNNIDHGTISFIDDMINIVSSKNHDSSKCYLMNFHYLLYKFHQLYMLKINHDKTEMLTFCKNMFNC